VAGLGGAAVAVGLYAAAATPASLVAVRLLHGAAGGVLVPALFTLVGDLTPEGSRGRAMGRTGAFIGAAAVVGPAVAGLLRGVAGFTVVFGAVAAVLALGALLAAASLRETVARPAVRRGARCRGGEHAPAARARTHPLTPDAARPWRGQATGAATGALAVAVAPAAAARNATRPRAVLLLTAPTLVPMRRATSASERSTR
jgi:MFS family permease